MISLTIDGRSVEVPEGTTVLRAAEQAGITIPTLCDHPALPPYGGCRLCVVEVQGFRTPIASCTLPVNPGMMVKTDTEKLRSIRKFILTMLFSERNHFCPFCQKTGGDCELQNAAYGEEMTHWPISPNWSHFPVDASHPYFIFDHNRCILCRRCVRACANLVGNFTLDMENRGARTLVVADYGLLMGESSCIRCGTCVQVCPTGALIERNSAYQGLEKDAEEIQSICTACSVGCGTRLLVRDNRIIRVLGDYDAPVNGGVLCGLGRYQSLEDNRPRVKTPLIRREGGLAPVSWDEAIAVITARLGEANQKVSALVSSRLPAEDLYTFRQLFGAALGASNVATIEEGMTSANIEDEQLIGNLDDLKDADCVLVIGADLVKSHQVAGFFVKRNRPKGVSIIVVDPYENEMEKVAHFALRNHPGSDADVLNGLVAGVVNLGFNKFGADAVDPEMITRAVEISGIPAETLVAVSQVLGAAQKPVIVFGKGITQAADGAMKQLFELARACGAKLINPMGKANSAAAHSYGLDHKFEPGDSDLVYLALGDDFPSKRLEKSISENSFLVVQASHLSPVVDKADVVLPVTMWAEESGAYLNLEGRLQTVPQVLEPPVMVRTNRDALLALATALQIQIDDNWRASLMVRN
jgi:formate dehydrogenase major subunit